MEADNQTTRSIVLNDLKVGYRKTGKTRSVYGPVNAAIYENEMVGVIGRNGIGKSTLLRTLAGLQPSTRGDIFINGKSLKRISPKEMARLVGFVSTEPVHAFQMRVKELIALGRFPYSGWFGRLNKSDRKAISDAVEYTATGNLLKKSIHELSDGERQKVMIARALAQDTFIVILDEPTAFLDLPARYEILRILSNLTLKNKIIIFSTHDLSMAIEVADKLWVMTGDELTEGSPEDLLINDTFRKLFLGSPAVFDPASLQFRFEREFRRKITIKGNNSQLTALTRKAMERIGISVSETNADLMIELGEISGKPSWHLYGMQLQEYFESIYQMVSFMKKHLLNR